LALVSLARDKRPNKYRYNKTVSPKGAKKLVCYDSVVKRCRPFKRQIPEPPRVYLSTWVLGQNNPNVLFITLFYAVCQEGLPTKKGLTTEKQSMTWQN